MDLSDRIFQLILDTVKVLYVKKIKGRRYICFFFSICKTYYSIDDKVYTSTFPFPFYINRLEFEFSCKTNDREYHGKRSGDQIENSLKSL